jgi:glycosyltransferase involved in cell wall biosynthesis
MTRVDVIIPCYNYGAMLEACVQSVLSQQHVDVRVLIMDDASSDTTESVGRRLARLDHRVDYRRHAVNRGHIATYNEALAVVAGDYCVILSADDLLTPGSLSRATRFMERHRDVGLAFGRDITFRDAPPAAVAGPAQCAGRIWSYPEFLERSCRLGHTGIQAPAAIVRTSVHRTVGGYLPELPHSGDTEIWLRLAAHAAVAELDAEQAFRRLHQHNMSLGFSPLRRLEEQKRAFAIHFDQCRVDPAVATYEPILNQTIADAAFWSAVRAFEAGDEPVCDAFLAFSTTIVPDVVHTPAWRRFRWKRRVGASLWRRLTALAAPIARAAIARRENRSTGATAMAGGRTPT